MKCPHCGKVPYPARNENGTLNWKNILKIDWSAMIWVLLILFIAWAYKHDTAECFDLVEHTQEYCAQFEGLNTYQTVPTAPESILNKTIEVDFFWENSSI